MTESSDDFRMLGLEVTELAGHGSAARLAETVIAEGLCIGCGACAVGEEPRFEIRETEDGFFDAIPAHVADSRRTLPDYTAFTCPHSGLGPDEDEIGRALFALTGKHNSQIGYWHAAGAFSLRDQADRLRGSSGGGVTWLLRQLIESNKVDAVLHVKAAPEGDERCLYAYGISHTVEELEDGRKSAYYPVSMTEAINVLKERHGRYAIVAIPCFAKALRKMALVDPIVADRLHYVVGIVCGHLKSKNYAEFLGWSVGVPPARLRAIDFRVKSDRGGAGDYAFRVRSTTATVDSLRAADYFGTPWELGLMKYKACDYCDDVFCETADVVFGDAWIPPYDTDWRGHNVVVSRRPEITALFSSPRVAREIDFEEILLDRLIASQAGGLRHRREGLAFRLAHDKRVGRWVPRKRNFATSDQVPQERASMYFQRVALRELSLKNFRRAKSLNSFLYFVATMSGPVFRYYVETRGLRVALRQSYPHKWLVRQLRRLGVRRAVSHRDATASKSSGERVQDCIKLFPPVQAVKRLKREINITFRHRGWRETSKRLSSIPRKAPVKRISNLLIVPSDPWLVVGSRGDDAMITTLICETRKRNPECQFGIVCVSAPLPQSVVEIGAVPEPVWLGAGYDAFLELLDRYDAVAVVGADVMDGHFSPSDALRAWSFADLAARRGLRAFVIGFSFSEQPKSQLADLLSKLSPALKLYVREAVSKRRIDGIASVDSQLVADSAFLLPHSATAPEQREADAWIAEQRARGQFICAFNTHPMIFKDCNPVKVSLLNNLFRDIIRKLAQKHSVSLFLIPHDFRDEVRGDNVSLRPLYEMLKPDLGDRVFYAPSECRAAELKALVSGADLLITGRMHLGIGALAMGVPMWAINYQDKFVGLFEHFGLLDQRMDPDNALDPSRLEVFLDGALQCWPAAGEQIRAALPKVMERAAKNFEMLDDLSFADHPL